jgi:hypothetical protein
MAVEARLWERIVRPNVVDEDRSIERLLAL